MHFQTMIRSADVFLHAQDDINVPPLQQCSFRRKRNCTLRAPCGNISLLHVDSFTISVKLAHVRNRQWLVSIVTAYEKFRFCTYNIQNAYEGTRATPSNHDSEQKTDHRKEGEGALCAHFVLVYVRRDICHRCCTTTRWEKYTFMEHHGLQGECALQTGSRQNIRY